MIRHKCSVCGMPWRDCAHVSFEDAYAAKRAFVVGVTLLVVAAVVFAGVLVWAMLP